VLILCNESACATQAAKGTGDDGNKNSQILFEGKLFCSLKRNVIFPYAGRIISVKAATGQDVKDNDVLLRYRLYPEDIRALRRHASLQHVRAMELRLAEIDHQLSLLRSQQSELEQLALKKMAPAKKLKQVEREIELFVKKRAAEQERLELERKLANHELSSLEDMFGEEVSHGHVPEVVSLRCTLTGNVVSLRPNIRDLAEVARNTLAFEIGIMDPMLMRAQIHEIEAVKLELGDKAELSFTSMPDRRFEGTLSRISWTPISAHLDQPSYYEVEITVPNPDRALKEGFRGQALFCKPR